jgi:hypothetical protein
MRFTRFSSLCVGLVAIALLVPSVMLAQSTVNGAISGTVTDASGAVLPNLKVTLKSLERGFTQEATTNAQGFYQFPLLEPGTYSITIAAPSFKTETLTATVSVGQNAIINAKLEVGAAGTTVEVTSEAALLQTETSEITTTFNAREISEVPNPGNDLSFIAQTAPGSVMNTGSGYGNFSNFGVSASSNLFTLNGMYDNDPFLNLNNSGATNLLLGQNEVAEATVVTNGYSGQYGGFVGANVNYITKSGSNNWHGNANYWWNGRAMNANDYFHKDYVDPANDLPRAFDNANQYAASFGGPIWKNKAFFFWNYEGLRVLLPTSATLHVTTPDFEQAITDNLTALGLTASLPFYQEAFGFYNNVKGSTPVPGYPGNGDPSGCQTQVYTDPEFPGGSKTFGGPNFVNPCSQTIHSSPVGFTHEYLDSGRFDFNVTNNDKVFVRLQEDIGVQASYTDPLSTVFNATSYQPEYQGQISWNRPVGTKGANNLLFSSQYYRAIFGPLNLAAALAAFPTTLLLNDGSLSTVGGEDFVWPQGRNVTGYQIVDDFSYNLSSKHTLKFGLYFHRNLISDHDYGFFTSGYDLPLSLDDFYYGGSGTGATGGGATVLLQNFAQALDQPIKLYQLGVYAQDEWKVTSNLKLTLALRGDHNSNPYCGTKCFARFGSSFTSAGFDHNVNTPYNQTIETGEGQALASFSKFVLQPRMGFSWSPSASRKTVVRGGIGIFMDSFQGSVADNLSGNVPLVNDFTVVGAHLSPTETTGNVFQSAAASNTALLNGFGAGATFPQIQAAVSAAGGIFSAPNFSNASGIVAPTTQEWNLEVQQGIGNSTVFILNYVGNHGIHETVQFNGVNAFCPPAALVFQNSTGGTYTVNQCASGFGGSGVSQVQPDQRFNEVTEFRTVGTSHYAGLNASIQHRFSHGLQMQGNYTWGHATDDVSNGGFNPFIDSGTGNSLLNPVNNNNLRQYNYGNADYDARQSFNMNYVYELPKGPTPLLKGWQLSGTWFFRTGFPFTVVNSAASGTLSGTGFGGPAFANYSSARYEHCSGSSGSLDVGINPCLTTSNFPDFNFTPIASNGQPVFVGAINQLASNTLSQTRNQFSGPHYWDTDLTLMKYTRFPGWETAKLGLGAQFFNLLNHPNFASPINDINNGGFGQVQNLVNPPTSILGSFLGGDASPRLIQLTMKINF